MATQLLRFPHLCESILNLLDNQTLVKCKEANRIWYNSINSGKVQWIKMIEKHVVSDEKVPEIWKNTISKTPTKMIKELAIEAEKFYKKIANDLENYYKNEEDSYR